MVAGGADPGVREDPVMVDELMDPRRVEPTFLLSERQIGPSGPDTARG